MLLMNLFLDYVSYCRVSAPFNIGFKFVGYYLFLCLSFDYLNFVIELLNFELVESPALVLELITVFSPQLTLLSDRTGSFFSGYLSFSILAFFKVFFKINS